MRVCGLVRAADPAGYAACAANGASGCRYPILGPRPYRTDLKGTIFPGVNPSYGSEADHLARLFDGQIVTDGSYGQGMLTTATSSEPYVRHCTS